MPSQTHLGDDKSWRVKTKLHCGHTKLHRLTQCFFLIILLPGRWRARRRRGWRSKSIRRLPHEAHERWLQWSKLLRHQRLRHPWWWTKNRLAKLTLRLARLILTSTSTSTSTSTGLASTAGVVAPAAAVTLVLIWARVVAVPAISASVPEGGSGGGGSGAVSITAVAAVTVEATAAVFAAAGTTTTRAHAAITLLLVHEVRVVGAAATVTHSATCNKQQM